jgi:hypothetical protein
VIRSLFITIFLPTIVIVAACGLWACERPQDPGTVAGEEIPEMDVFLVDIRSDGAVPTLGPPRNVTSRPGYDNQPVFLPDSAGFLFTSWVDMQADTCRYDIGTEAIERVTASTSGEWAPALTPDGQGFTISRDEPEGYQRLWRFPMSGRSLGVVLRDVTGAGYHTWVDSDTIALYMLAEPPQLALVDVDTEERRIVASGVGRCIQRVPGRRELAFVDKSNPEAWVIRYLDLETMRTSRAVPATAGSEDFAIGIDGSILMGEGARLFRYPSGGSDWELLGDWSHLLSGSITRIALSPTGRHMAIVVKES